MTDENLIAFPGRRTARPRGTDSSEKVAEVLDRLNRKAQRGELTGLCYVAYSADHTWEANALGRPRRDPDRAVGILHRLINRLLEIRAPHD